MLIKNLNSCFVCIALIGIMAMASAASADVATFDDITTGPWVNIPNGYHGFEWDTFAVVDGAGEQPGTGYETGIVSGKYVAYNKWAEVATVSDGMFDFNGAFLTSAWIPSLPVQVDGYLAGNPIYSRIVVVNDSGPTWVQFDFLGVDRLRFGSLDLSQFVMDDFTYSNVIPAPGAVLLGAIGLGMVGWLKRRGNKIEA